jgi:hypothetical protein
LELTEKRNNRLRIGDITRRHRIILPELEEPFDSECHKRKSEEITSWIQPVLVEKPLKKFMVEDIDLEPLGEFSTYEECEKVFLERRPQFDKESIKHYIYEL